MKREQVLKILKVAIISTLVIFIAEGVFSIPAINNWFSELITNSSGAVVWLIIWLIMFLQVTVLNIPAYVILSACATINGIEILSFTYILVVLSAYMCGCLLAYWIGYRFGKKAVKWCAGSEEDYDKWSNYLNKKGKLWYFLTVVFPFFPDDLLCLVAGAVKFDLGFYTIANFFGRGIGLVTMILVLNVIDVVSGNFPIMLIVWAIALLAEIITYYIIKKRHKNATIQTTQENPINDAINTKNNIQIEDKKNTIKDNSTNNTSKK